MSMTRMQARSHVLLAGLGMWSVGAIALPQHALAWQTATGPRGGQAVAGPRGAAAVGPNGNAAVAARPGYRPPAVVAPVPVYPGYARPVAGAVAVGAVAGATAGAVARATAPPPVVVAQPMRVGTTLAVLPAGCGAAQAGGVTYYRCGEAWVRPYMQGSTVTYLVIPPP